MPVRIDRASDPEAVERILRQLPDWFGVPEAIAGYVEHAGTYQSYLAVDGENVMGVALLQRHFAESVELHLIAVDPARHRDGIGTALLGAIEGDLRSAGTRLLQVHTVGRSFPSPAYARTRAFYLGSGFLPLQEFDRIDWDGPTLVLVKVL